MGENAIADLIDYLSANGPPDNMKESECQLILRALRLLAAAEANDGTTAEVLPNFVAEQLCSDYIRGKCGDPTYDDCSCQRIVRGYEQINNERNGLAARVLELEVECSAADIYGRTSASHGFINAPKWRELADETKQLYREAAARSQP